MFVWWLTVTDEFSLFSLILDDKPQAHKLTTMLMLVLLLSRLFSKFNRWFVNQWFVNGSKPCRISITHQSPLNFGIIKKFQQKLALNPKKFRNNFSFGKRESIRWYWWHFFHQWQTLNWRINTETIPTLFHTRFMLKCKKTNI